MYGKEVVEKYGESIYKQSREAFKNMSEADYNEMTALGEQILSSLKICIEKSYPADSPSAQALAKMHKKWLTFAWGSYTPAAHLGLVDMYLADVRFKDFYDSAGTGACKLLRDAVYIMLD